MPQRLECLLDYVCQIEIVVVKLEGARLKFSEVKHIVDKVIEHLRLVNSVLQKLDQVRLEILVLVFLLVYSFQLRIVHFNNILLFF